jgi:glycosyltransferase involved in cell wall biosynthesis
MSPTISVVTSCYNASEYLTEAVESILNQTVTDFELLLIDDGSTDNTVELLRNFEKKDKRIIVVEKRNTGLGDSLNVGLRLAKSPWIARMDQDDVAMSDRFEKQLAYVFIQNEIILLGTGCLVIDENGRIIKKKIYPATQKELIHKLVNNEMAFPHSSVLFRRDKALSIGGYRGRLNGAEDRDLWLRLSRLGRIACLQEPLIKLRRHQASMTAGNYYNSSVLARAAIISYKLNKKNHQDPIELDEPNFQAFINWLKNSLEKYAHTEEVRLYFDIEKLRYKSGGFRTKMEILNLLISRMGIQVLQHRFLVNDITAKLTNEWIENTHEKSSTIKQGES